MSVRVILKNIPYGKEVYECPKCGHDNTPMAENMDNWGDAGSGKPIEVFNYKSGSDYLRGNWASWTEVVTCEKCRFKFKLDDGW